MLFSGFSWALKRYPSAARLLKHAQPGIDALAKVCIPSQAFVCRYMTSSTLFTAREMMYPTNITVILSRLLLQSVITHR